MTVPNQNNNTIKWKYEMDSKICISFNGIKHCLPKFLHFKIIIIIIILIACTLNR